MKWLKCFIASLAFFCFFLAFESKSEAVVIQCDAFGNCMACDIFGNCYRSDPWGNTIQPFLVIPAPRFFPGPHYIPGPRYIPGPPPKHFSPPPNKRHDPPQRHHEGGGHRPRVGDGGPHRR